MKTRILLSNRQRAHGLDGDRLRAAAAAIATDLWDHPVEISITFLGRRAMAAANREYRGYLGATDQISFPMDHAHPTPDGVRLVGDLLLCPAVIASQCGTRAPDGRPETGVPDREIALVLIHGLLHLHGATHDGDDDAAAMVAEETRLYATHAHRLSGIYLML